MTLWIMYYSSLFSLLFTTAVDVKEEALKILQVFDGVNLCTSLEHL